MGGVNELTVWRLEKAENALSGARKNFKMEEYGICLNRCYYAVFYAMQAANSLHGYDSRKHSGVISFFRKTFLKSGLMDAEISRIITDTSNYREKADYEDRYEATKEAAAEQLENAVVFLKEVCAYLQPIIEKARQTPLPFVRED